MTFFQLVLRNLRYHWRTNLAVLLGVLVSTAVLTGALLVGDALRGSLHQLSDQRLGWINQALIGGRMIHESILTELPSDQVSGALLVRATAMGPGGVSPVSKVNFLGVDSRFWNRGLRPTMTTPDSEFWQGSQAEVVINRTLADQLEVSAGKEVEFRIPRSSSIPRETLLGRKENSESIEVVKLKVRTILGDQDFGTRFQLDPSVDPPRNAFLPLPALQTLLKHRHQINTILLGGKPLTEDQIASQMRLEDWGLLVQTPASRAQQLVNRLDRNGDGQLSGTEWYRRVRGERLPLFAASLLKEIKPRDPDVLQVPEIESALQRLHPYVSIESSQLLLEPSLSQAIIRTAEESHLSTAPTLVYLANSIRDPDNNNPQQSIPYSIVAALNPGELPPLGPFLPPGIRQLTDEQIILVNWPGSPLPFRPGMKVDLFYFPPEEAEGNQEVHRTFQVAGTAPLPLNGAAADPYLTPEFPGLTDKTDIRSWDPPFPFDRSRIRSGDANEQFWEQWRTTPKAYITLAAGQKLWGSRFGNLTSIRLAFPEGIQKNTLDFEKRLLQRLQADRPGVTFRNLRQDAAEASQNGTDFSLLFLAFSFFLILAALLLVALLFRLNTDRRASEIGLLLASGFRNGTVHRLMIAEGLLLTLVGAALGILLAILYATLLVRLLAALWPGDSLRTILRPDFSRSVPSLTIGYLASVLSCLLAMVWSLRGLTRIPAANLLAGRASVDDTSGRTGSSWANGLLSFVSGILAVVILLWGTQVQNHEARAGCFFGSGFLFLTALLLFFRSWLRHGGTGNIQNRGLLALTLLGIRNAARNPLRSLLTAGLLASAAFILVAVESFRRHAEPHSNNPQSPDGGFNLVGELQLPLYLEPSSEAARQQMQDRLREYFGNSEQKAQEAMETIKKANLVALRSRAGDDASCLNLYQARQPRLIGFPKQLINRGGFQFASTIEPSMDNSWLLLREPDKAVPVFGEENTVVWSLKTGLNGTLSITDAAGGKQELRIVGLLKDSVFQSSLVLSEQRFLQLFPNHPGYNLLLIQTPPQDQELISRLLRIALADNGLEVTPSREKLEAYLSVENTYLSTFQALGGLGLLLGSLGLAVVLLRSVWERRAEFALLRALGYRQSALGWIIMAENCFLLLVGLTIGAVAAVLSVLPPLLSGGGQIAWGRLLVLLGLVPILGIVAGSLALFNALRAPLISSLRRE